MGQAAEARRHAARIAQPAERGRTPNVTDYEAARETFRWEDVRRRDLDGLPGGGLNIGYEAVDRHAYDERADKTAIRWIAKSGAVRDITYTELKALTDRFANLLGALGVERGEGVYTLLGRVPALYIAALGALKYGAVYTPLFSAFGPEPVRQRLEIGAGAVLVTTAALYRKKVAPIREQLPALRHVLLAGAAEGEALPAGTESFEAKLQGAETAFEVPPTDPEDRALLHFTSGTTGKPKGAIHVHEAVVAHYATAAMALDLHEHDTVWCTADPGWVTGTSYGIIAPLAHGTTMVVDEAEFDAERWYAILQDHKVSVWYSAPTAIRMLMKAGRALAGRYDLSALRFLASVGEPLNPEAVIWSNEVFGRPFHDNWWQTETGAIMIANLAVGDIKPGSMGRPLPGVDAAIVERLEDGYVREIEEPNQPGELALRPGWPSMFRGYLHQEERYRNCFREGWYLSEHVGHPEGRTWPRHRHHRRLWYLTEDLAMRDEEGYFWFVGRADDMIKSAGHLIGPFEVESALVSHPAVAEAAVIGVPDERAGEAVKAYVTLNAGFEPGEALTREIMGHARKALGAAVAPRMIEIADSLPKTRSGKIMRRLLKARELGLPEGDTSTLETFS